MVVEADEALDVVTLVETLEKVEALEGSETGLVS